MKFKDLFNFFVVPVYLFFETVFCFMISSIYWISDKQAPVGGYICATILTIMIWLPFFICNVYQYIVNGKRNFSFINDFIDIREEKISGDKRKAMYPQIDNRLKKRIPGGVIFGKDAKKYVCRDLNEDGHIFVIGGSGSGKSSCLVIPTILSNPNVPIFAIDIKGELHRKATRKGDVRVKVFDPADRTSFGYDPLYRLNDKSTNQEILETMRLISQSLIPLPVDIKDPFWKLSARSLLTGLLIYYYKKGYENFIDITDEIMSKPIQEQISEVMKCCVPDDIEYKYLVEFSNMAEQTISGIFMELSNHITIFVSDQNIRYALRDNYAKITPRDLESKNSIYLSISEDKLTSYYDVLQMILNQTLAELERRPEDSHKILFIIDELPRILSAGKLEKLLDGARTLRSRNVILFLVTQSTEALMSAYSEYEVADLISNCPYVIVLSANSVKTQQMIKNWCGVYKEKEVSWTGNNIFDRTPNYSYREKDVVLPTDLMQLQQNEEAILISPYGYNRIKKAPYYKDLFFVALADEVKQYNNMIGGM